MAKIVITKEELEHDQVLETTDKVLHWVRDRIVPIGILLVVTFGAYAALVLYQGHRTKVLMDGNNLLAEAEEKYSAGLVENGWASAERVDAMQEVSDLADRILDEYSGTPVARQALMLKGNAWFNAGDPIVEAAGGGAKNTQKSIEVFEEFVATSERNSFEEAAGNLSLAYAYENAFFLNRASTAMINDALRLYASVEGNPQAGFLADEARLARARILAFNDENESAEKLYREVMKNRYKPVPAPPESPTQTEQVLSYIRQSREQFTLAGTARAGLRRLGVDVNAEYPLVEPAKPAL